MKHFNSQKVITQPAKIGEEGLDAAKDIVKYGGEIVDRSASMITSAKSLVINDPWDDNEHEKEIALPFGYSNMNLPPIFLMILMRSNR